MLAAEELAGRFVIQELASVGGMGSVYRARDPSNGEGVAIKVLCQRDARDAERFAREARILSTLHHPGIVRYVGQGILRSGEPYLAMEWLEGEDLAQRLARAPLTIEESVALVRRAAEAAACAHARGVIHRDLKPSNIFLLDGDPGRIKLLDFGIACSSQVSVRLTRTDSVIGTVGYMAPEQARGDSSIDPRADVFALGAVLYECLAGRPAFTGEHVVAVLAKLLLQEVPPVRRLRPDVSKALEALVARMLAKDPCARPKDAAAVAVELASFGIASEPRSAWVAVTQQVALTGREQHLLSLILVGPYTVTPAADEAFAAAARFGARIERLADGSTLVISTGADAAVDLAARAARCALALRQALPDAAMALVTGLGEIAELLPVGQIVDHAAALRRAHGGARGVVLDEVTAGLLDARFQVDRSSCHPELVREHELHDRSRTLLGRPSLFVGREREMRALADLFDECMGEGVAQAVLITGPPGIGKSRVRYELARVIQERREDVEIWTAWGDTMSAGSAFALVAATIRQAIGALPGDAPEVRRRKLASRVARRVGEGARARVTTFLGEVVGASLLDDDVQLRAAREDASIMAHQIRRAWEDFMEAECAAGPLVIVLEDLQWGDLTSVMLFDAALRLLAKRPLFVLATARPEVHESFPRLWQARRVQEIRLGELTPRAAEQLARHALGNRADARVMAAIMERAEGHVFYLEELIRAVAEGQGDALPETILMMVQARLASLDPAARRVLRAASVFGELFQRSSVEALLAGDVQQVSVQAELARMVDDEVLRRVGRGDSSDGEYAFRHALLREGAYALLTKADRVIGHRLAAEWLERSGETDAMRLAEHFDRGGEPSRAARWYLRAAEQALQGNDLAAVVARSERGIERTEQPQLKGALLSIRGQGHAWSDDWAAVEVDADEAMRLSIPGDRFWCLAVAGKLMSGLLLGKPEALAAVLGHLANVVPAADAVDQFSLALGMSVYTLVTAAQFDLARCQIAELERLSDSTGGRDPMTRGWLHHALGIWKRVWDGAPWAALAEANRMLDAFDEACGRNQIALAQVMIGLNLWLLGDHARAESVLEGALETSDPRWYAASLGKWYLAWVRADRGALDDARAIGAELIDAELARGNRFSAGCALWTMADILSRRGDLDGAERSARAALGGLELVPLEYAGTLATLADIRLRRGDVASAVALSTEALERHERVGAAGIKDAYVRLVHIEARSAAGDHAGARVALRRARARLLERAAMIGDERLRRSFLTEVREHERTLTLAGVWVEAA